MDYLLAEDMTTGHDIANSNTLFFDKYISSRRNMQKEARTNGYELVKVDQETGGIIEEKEKTM